MRRVFRHQFRTPKSFYDLKVGDYTVISEQSPLGRTWLTIALIISIDNRIVQYEEYQCTLYKDRFAGQLKYTCYGEFTHKNFQRFFEGKETNEDEMKLLCKDNTIEELIMFLKLEAVGE